MKTVIVRQYGLLPPLNWGDDCLQHMALQAEFWDRLVEIEAETSRAWHALFEGDADYAALKARTDALNLEIDGLWKVRKAARGERKGKDAAEDEATEAQLKTLTRQRSEAWTALKARRQSLLSAGKDPEIAEIRAELKSEKARLNAAGKRKSEHLEILKSRLSEIQYRGDSLQARLDALESERREKVKAAYQSSGLWADNYSAVRASYETARVRAFKTGATLRAKRFSYQRPEGRFNVHLINGATTDELQEGRNTKIRLERMPEATYQHLFTGAFSGKQSSRLRLLTFTIYTDKDEAGKFRRRTLTLPLVLHRPLPEEALIKDVCVKLSRAGGRVQWTATFTCTVLRPEPTHGAPSACGINLGWRLTRDGIRIATLVGTDGQERHVHLPECVSKRMDAADALQTRMDDGLNQVRAALASWEDAAAPERWRILREDALKSRSFGPLYRLEAAWRNIDYRPDRRAYLQRWRDIDKFDREQAEGLRRRALNHRRDFYRKKAKAIADRYALIGMGQLDLARAAQRVVAEVEETTLPAPARKIRQRVALSEFVEWIEKQSAKSGAKIVDAERPVTSTCHACGKRDPVPAEEIVHRCSHCGEMYDRDLNAARIALQDAVGGPHEQAPGKIGLAA